MLGQFLTTCGTIHFLVDDCLGPLFTTVGTIGQWSFFVFSQICIDRWPIFFQRSISTVNRFFFVWIDLDGRYRPIFGYYESKRPSISTEILLKCNRTDRRYRPCSPVGAIEPTVDIDRDWPTGRLKSTDRTDDTSAEFQHWIYFPPNGRRSTVFWGLFQRTSKQTSPYLYLWQSKPLYLHVRASVSLPQTVYD